MNENLGRDLTIKEVAALLGMSEKWVRQQIRDMAVEVQKYGHKIKFTPEQVEKFRAQFTQPAAPARSITTGRSRKKAS